MPDLASITTDQNATACHALGATLALPIGYEVFTPIRDELAVFVGFANNRAAKYRDEEIRPFLLEELGSRMFSAGRTTHGAAVDHQRAHLEREAEYRRPAASLDRTHDPERRALFRGMDMKTAMRALADASLADLAALVADGNLAPLPSEAFAEAERRYLEANVIEKAALEARFAAKPTLADPLPVGADTEAARKQAEVILKGHAANAEMINIHRRGIHDFAKFLASVFDLAADAAFARMVA